jgi:hypothetical protein
MVKAILAERAVPARRSPQPPDDPPEPQPTMWTIVVPARAKPARA